MARTPVGRIRSKVWEEGLGELVGALELPRGAPDDGQPFTQKTKRLITLRSLYAEEITP